MTHTDKQPQTCYVECFGKDATHYLDNQSSLPIKEVENVYLFTPAELEALKAEWQRELQNKVSELLLFIEEDGKPVDGFRFRDIATELKGMSANHLNNKI